MALKGTLKDFSVADIFQLIGQQQKSGSLYVRNNEREAHIVFDGGRVVLGTFRKSDEDLLLGTMLLRAGVISAEQLQTAIENQRVTLRSLGDILKSQGAITTAILGEFVALQLKEVLFRLFQWKEGLYEFVAEQIQYNKSIIKPISAEGILMDGFRMLDEWPMVMGKVGTLEAVFRPLSDLSAQSEVDPAEKRVWALIDGHRTLQEIVYKSRIGTFEGARIVASFLDKGMIQKVDQLSQTRVDPKILESMPDTMGSWLKANLFPLFLVLLGAAVIPVLAFRTPSNFNARFSRSPAPYDQASQINEEERIRLLLELFALEKGSFPASLDEIAADSLGNDWDYRSFGSTYVLQHR